MRRKLIPIIFLIFLFVPSLAFSAGETLVTDVETASAIAFNGSCWFNGIAVRTDGTNAVTLNIYDGIAASAIRLIPTNMAIDGDANYFGYKPPFPIRCRTGIYVAVAIAGGGTCAYQVFYSQVRP